MSVKKIYATPHEPHTWFEAFESPEERELRAEVREFSWSNFEHLRENPCGQLCRHRAICVQFVGEHAPGDEFHHQVITAVVFAEGEQARQVRMVEPCHRDRFLKESLFDDGVAGVLFVQLFDGDDAPGLGRVFGLEDRAEAAAADIFSD